MELKTFRTLLWAAATVYAVFPDLRRILYPLGGILIQVEERCKGDTNFLTVDDLWSIVGQKETADKDDADDPSLSERLLSKLGDSWDVLFYFGVLVAFCQYLKTRGAEHWIVEKVVTTPVPKSSPREASVRTLATPPAGEEDVVTQRCKDKALQRYIGNPFWRDLAVPKDLLQEAQAFQDQSGGLPPRADFLSLEVDLQWALILAYCMHGTRGKHETRMSVNFIAVTLLSKTDPAKLYGMIRVLGVPSKNEWARQCAEKGIVVPIRSDTKVPRPRKPRKGAAAPKVLKPKPLPTVLSPGEIERILGDK